MEKTDRRTYSVKRGTVEIASSLRLMADLIFRTGEEPGEVMNDQFPLLFSNENIQNTYYIEEDSGIASQASIFREKVFINGLALDVVSLGSVCTLPKFRHKGMSSAIIRKIIANLKEEHCPLLLISGDIELYTKLGAVKGGIILRGKISSGNTTSKYVLKIVPMARRISRVRHYWELYSKEPYRYLRTERQMAALLNATWFLRKNYKMVLIEATSSGRTIAYVIAWVRAGSRTGHVIEYAGSREAVFSIFQNIHRLLSIDQAEFKVQVDDITFRSICNESGIRLTPAYSQGTVRVIDPVVMIEQMKPWFLEHMGHNASFLVDKEDNWLLRMGPRTQEGKGMNQLSKFLFGKEEGCLAIPLMFTDDLNYV